jgi:hypothetical protein
MAVGNAPSGKSAPMWTRIASDETMSALNGHRRRTATGAHTKSAVNTISALGSLRPSVTAPDSS